MVDCFSKKRSSSRQCCGCTCCWDLSRCIPEIALDAIIGHCAQVETCTGQGSPSCVHHLALRISSALFEQKLDHFTSSRLLVWTTPSMVDRPILRCRRACRRLLGRQASRRQSPLVLKTWHHLVHVFHTTVSTFSLSWWTSE